jgi:hypothetical protein
MTRHAVLIGCEQYEDTHFEPLSCAREDVKQLSQVLADPELCDPGSTHVFSLGESRTEVLKHIEELCTRTVRSDDFVLIYFSGHAVVDNRDRLCLAFRETEETALASTSLPIAQLIDLMGSSRCQDAVLILDCCYSGAARNSFDLPANWTGRGFSIMTSSTDVQTSKAKEGELTSLFTKFLLEGLVTGHADLDNDGVVSVGEAYLYAHDCVQGSGLSQTPMEFSIRKGSIPLARNRRYQGPIEPSSVPPDQLRKFLAVQNMVKLVAANPRTSFFVMVLPHYFIEEVAYPASGLTVSQGHTPNMRQTIDGFECDAFFQPHMLGKPAREGKEVVNGVMKVRMKLKNEHILIISGKIEGKQVDLFT